LHLFLSFVIDVLAVVMDAFHKRIGKQNLNTQNRIAPSMLHTKLDAFLFLSLDLFQPIVATMPKTVTVYSAHSLSKVPIAEACVTNGGEVITHGPSTMRR
jgi:hypothetical protein